LLFSPLQRNIADRQQIMKKKKKKISLFISCWNRPFITWFFFSWCNRKTIKCT
jgi:hypothetical protein